MNFEELEKICGLKLTPNDAVKTICKTKIANSEAEQGYVYGYSCFLKEGYQIEGYPDAICFEMINEANYNNMMAKIKKI